MPIREDNTTEVVVEATERAVDILRVLALEVAVEAKKIVPVRTGKLKRSIHARVYNDVAIIGSRVFYAPYVEAGTPKMSARPYLRPALEIVVSRWKGKAEITPGWIIFTVNKAEADIEQIAAEVVREAKRVVPVLTGALRRSIRAEVDIKKREIAIGSPLHYAPYIEITKPYLRPAFEAIKKRWGGFNE